MVNFDSIVNVSVPQQQQQYQGEGGANSGGSMEKQETPANRFDLWKDQLLSRDE